MGACHSVWPLAKVRERVRRLGCNVRVARLEGARERVQQKSHGERFKHRVDVVPRNPQSSKTGRTPARATPRMRCLGACQVGASRPPS